MDNYIRIYEKILPDDFCDSIVSKFEDNKDHHETHNSGPMSFTQIDLGKHSDVWSSEETFVLNNLMSCVSMYKEDCEIIPIQWPRNDVGYESLRIKRYLPNDEDRFDDHVDVTDYNQARRFLVMFAYLNDNDKGETIINPKDDMFVSPCTKGNVLLFPCMWPWLHRASKPIKVSKYMIGSYLHYV